MDRETKHTLCPSAQPDMAEASVFGIVNGTPLEPRVSYLDRDAAIDPADYGKLGSLQPGHVFRVSAKCEESRCVHFRNSRCSLAQRLVDRLHPVVDGVPHCRIRPNCRWFAEQGTAACLRCPQVVTFATERMDTLIAIAAPEATVSVESKPPS